MDTRKITLIATIAVIALVAVGIGYAYTASTSNSGNDANPEYVTLSQTGNGAYKFTNGVTSNAMFDTVNTGTNLGGEITSETKYKLSEFTTDVITGYTTIQLGKEITVNATQTNVSPMADLNCYFKTTNFNGTGDWKLFVVIDNDSSVEGVSNTYELVPTIVGSSTNNVINFWKALGAAEGTKTLTPAFTILNDDGNPGSYKTVSVKVYYGYANATHATGTATAPESKILDVASIEFKAVTNDHNPGDVHVSSVTINVPAATIEYGQNLDLAAIVMPEYAATKTVSWTSGATDVATVSSAGVVTPVALGNATITVTTSDGEKTATCAVTVVRATTVISSLTMADWTQSQAASDPVIEANHGGNTATYEYKAVGGAEWVSTKPSTAGNYLVKATIAQGDLYTSAVAVAAFTINPAS